MLDKFKSFPGLLQKQILLYLSCCAIGLATIIILLFFAGRWQLLFPSVVITAYFLLGAYNLFLRCAEGRYLEIHGICKLIERSAIRKRIKALHIEAEGHSIKIIPHQGTGTVREGDCLILYLADTASVYEVDNELVLCDVIAYGKDKATNGSKRSI